MLSRNTLPCLCSSRQAGYDVNMNELCCEGTSLGLNGDGALL